MGFCSKGVPNLSRNTYGSSFFLFYGINNNKKTTNIYRGLLQGGSWPSDMKYITCEQYDGTNTPERLIDLRSSFASVSLFSVFYTTNESVKQ